MSEIIADRKVFSLSEVLTSVKKTIQRRYTSSFWVKAEMNKLNYYQHSGHCYPDLVDKVDGKIKGEARAIIWASDFYRINQKFLTILREPLKDGIKILFSARVQFDPRYGLSLLILDIDPSFTLGDLAREKQETIIRLKSEKLYDRNKLLPLPVLPQRIAVISVETSKGYADFLNITSGNSWGYKFSHFLFPSLLQGDKAAATMITQLRRIKRAIKYFDVVAIIRGGGGEVGLTCYNNYDLAKEICTFPIPVITGIGHSTNETVSEMVAHTNAITPTKLGEFLIQQFHNFSIPVKEAEQKIAEESMLLIDDRKTALLNTIKLFRSIAEKDLMAHWSGVKSISGGINRQAKFLLLKSGEQLKSIRQEIAFSTGKTLITHQGKINNLIQLLGRSALLYISRSVETVADTQKAIHLFAGLQIKNERTRLENIETNVQNLHPSNVLKRGYSITVVNGKSVASAESLKKGDKIKTILASGSIRSTVTQTIINQEKK